MMFDRLELAEATWGFHPINWPRPPRGRPRFWQRQIRKRLSELEKVFGHLDDESLQRYWDEVAKGQSVYEDCGGYLLRCYRAMCGLSVEEPISHADILEKLLLEAARSTP
jgi:hypothetical protein